MTIADLLPLKIILMEIVFSMLVSHLFPPLVNDVRPTLSFRWCYSTEIPFEANIIQNQIQIKMNTNKSVKHITGGCRGGGGVHAPLKFHFFPHKSIF
jgi:hypothetical protein